MSVPTCEICGAQLAPAELPSCFTCGPCHPTTIGERALMVLERANAPLTYWDIQRLMSRQAPQSTRSNSLLVYLSRDLRICWAGKGMYGLYRHGLVPNVRGLGPAAAVHLLASPGLLNQDELHFVLQYQGYRYQYSSLSQALQRHLGYSWRNAVAAAESEAGRVRHEQDLAQHLQISRRSPRFQHYRQAIQDRVEQALAERARRLNDPIFYNRDRRWSLVQLEAKDHEGPNAYVGHGWLSRHRTTDNRALPT